MTESEFCEMAIGKPWINRAEGPDAYDCWGLVLDSFRQVDGLELPQIEGYADQNCSTEDAARGAETMRCFVPCRPKNLAIMAVFNNNGDITHVGRCLSGRVLHATSALGIRHDTYRAIINRYPTVRFYTYEPNNSPS